MGLRLIDFLGKQMRKKFVNTILDFIKVSYNYVLIKTFSENVNNAFKEEK